jgi:hypothetical protein
MRALMLHYLSCHIVPHNVNGSAVQVLNPQRMPIIDILRDTSETVFSLLQIACTKVF